MPLDLAAIRARWAKATRGPWKLFFDGDGYDEHTSEVTIARKRKGGVTTDWVVTNATMGIDDARAVAAAPTDIAALLSEIARLRAELDAKRFRFQRLRHGGGWHASRGIFSATVAEKRGNGILISDDALGWALSVDTIAYGPRYADCGPETGDAGKEAAYAAYLRACGIAPATVAGDRENT